MKSFSRTIQIKHNNVILHSTGPVQIIIPPNSVELSRFEMNDHVTTRISLG